MVKYLVKVKSCNIFKTTRVDNTNLHFSCIDFDSTVEINRIEPHGQQDSLGDRVSHQ